VIEGTRVFGTLEEAIADLNFVYATTARSRDNYKPVRSPVFAAGNLRNRFRAGEATGILFGRERWGLTNEEVALADEIVTSRSIPPLPRSISPRPCCSCPMSG
jgi:tRNA/rRNA methyltransferase